VICSHLKKHDFWIARYPANDNGTVVERLRPSWGVGWQYSSKATIPGINTKVDRNIFYKDYTEAKESGTMAKTKEQIIQNEKDGHQTFIYKLLLARTGINPKKNSAIGELAEKVEIAIEQEKKINEDIHQCKGQITCNIGRIIDEIRKDDGR